MFDPQVPSRRDLLRLHLNHHDRAGRLHPRRLLDPHGIPGPVQDDRRALSPFWTCAHKSDAHNILRHSPGGH